MAGIDWTPDRIAVLRAAVAGLSADEPDDSTFVLVFPANAPLAADLDAPSPTGLGALPGIVIQPGCLPMAPAPRTTRMRFQLGYARTRLAELTAAATAD